LSRWELPELWEWTAVGRIADVVGGGTPKASDPANFDDDGFPWLTPADLSDFEEEFIGRGIRSLSREGLASSSARMLPAGTVLFTSRAPIGYCVIAANPISTNQGFKSLILRESIDPRFIRLGVTQLATKLRRCLAPSESVRRALESVFRGATTHATWDYSISDRISTA
jgi:type I restriction enzyme S subunit